MLFYSILASQSNNAATLISVVAPIFNDRMAFALTGIAPEPMKILEKGQWYNNLAGAEINPATDKLYVVDALSVSGPIVGSINIHNASTLELISTISEKYYPSDVVLNPVTNSLYVSHTCNCPQGKSLTVIDGNTDSVIGTIDGLATPPSSAGGIVPGSVTTDANGVATFNLTYGKSSAIWIVTRIRAKTIVQGSETASEVQFVLPALLADTTPCHLPNSPYKF